MYFYFFHSYICSQLITKVGWGAIIVSCVGDKPHAGNKVKTVIDRRINSVYRMTHANPLTKLCKWTSCQTQII